MINTQEPPEIDLIRDIEAFCAAHNMTQTGFSLAAMNDKGFVARLKDGREVRRRTRARVHAFMAEMRSKK